ncbi:MAG TPA: MBL fold metallo-hydrolase [Firmicutes bacterium]|nr:MBL fold metallo-hydrolase [Bacillota bacterium]
MKRIKVLFDRDSIDKRLKIGWGLSFLIDENVLFDTGENGKYLLKNMEILSVNIEKIEKIVISHDHWDHTGGLWDLLEKKKDFKVYGCINFSNEFKDNVKNSGNELIEVENFIQIEKDIYTTGEIGGKYRGSFMPEQSLILKTENGLTVLTGCAHPGILEIIKEVKKLIPDEKIYMVAGGFHLIEEDRRTIQYIAEEFKKLGVKKAGPTHCSGPLAEDIFRREFGEDFVEIKVGSEILV